MSQPVVRLADGSILSVSDLPPSADVRWVASRKLTVVRAVVYGLISLETALSRYNLCEDEFFGWVNFATTHGENSLKTTYLKKYRQS